MREHERRLQGVGVAERVPGVHHGVMPDAHVNPRGEQLFDPGVAAPDGIAVEAALQRGVVERVGDHVHLRALQVVDQLVRVRVVVRVHGGGVAGGHPTLHAQPDRLRRHHLDETGLVVVSLVAVDVDAQAFVGSERECELDRHLAVLTRELEMRYGADDVDAEVDRLSHQVLAAVERHDSLLRKGDQLQGDLVADLFAQLGERAHGSKLRIADVDVAAHELDAVGELPAKHRADPLLHVLDGELLDPVRPDRDALEKGA